MESVVNLVNDIIWSNAFIVLALCTGLYFSIIMKFPQIRLVKVMWNLLFKKEDSKEGVSSFQAFALAISGRVGTGNIAGVATAIALGGPGAIFWMWVCAFIGSATAFIESTLGQIYKEVDGEEFRGGPAYYILKGLNLKWYAYTFAFATIIAMVIFLPGIQSKSISQGMELAFGMSPLITGLIICIPLGFVIFGGVHRIAKVAQIVVPFMAIAYILVSVVIIFLNISEVPKVFDLIISSAFGTNQMFAGILGMAISWGVKRGIYSNEAGQGSAPHAASAAEVDHPAEQGLVQAFSVYVDTLFVCTATAFMILFTGSYNVESGTIGTNGTEVTSYITENLPNIEYGPQYTQYAIESEFPGYGEGFVAIALFFFAFTTLMAYYYMAETNVSFLNRNKHKKWPIFLLRIIILSMTMYGVFSATGYVWTLGDIGVGIMAWLNIIAILLLQKPALKAFKDYEIKRESDKPMSFNPKELNIKNAKFWEDRLEN